MDRARAAAPVDGNAEAVTFQLVALITGNLQLFNMIGVNQCVSLDTFTIVAPRHLVRPGIIFPFETAPKIAAIVRLFQKRIMGGNSAGAAPVDGNEWQTGYKSRSMPRQ